MVPVVRQCHASLNAVSAHLCGTLERSGCMALDPAKVERFAAALTIFRLAAFAPGFDPHFFASPGGHDDVAALCRKTNDDRPARRLQMPTNSVNDFSLGNL